MKSKIVTFAGWHIIEFNSFYNKTQFSMVLFCCQQWSWVFFSDLVFNKTFQINIDIKTHLTKKVNSITWLDTWNNQTHEKLY